jgi:hypothetical protein
MNVFEAASTLPNGLHDAVLKRCAVDFGAGEATFELDAWIGDLDAEKEKERELYQAIELRLLGLIYLHLEPGGDWHLRPVEPTRVDLCDADSITHPEVQGMMDYFKARLFLEDRNAFLHFAAREAIITIK